MVPRSGSTLVYNNIWALCISKEVEQLGGTIGTIGFSCDT